MSRYHCTYTHMKSQKRKKWQDGIAVSNDTKLDIISLRDSDDAFTKAGPVLDTYYLTSTDMAGGLVGKSLETERFLVEVGDAIPTAPPGPSLAKPVHAAPKPPPQTTTKRFSVGLKRSGSVNSGGSGKASEPSQPSTPVLDSFTSSAAVKDVLPPQTMVEHDDDVTASASVAQPVFSRAQLAGPPLKRRTISEIFDLFRSCEPPRTYPPLPSGLTEADLAQLRHDVPAWCYNEDVWSQPPAAPSEWDALVAPTFATLAGFTEQVVCGGQEPEAGYHRVPPSRSPVFPLLDEGSNRGRDGGDWQAAIQALRPRAEGHAEMPRVVPKSQARSMLTAASISGFKPPVMIARPLSVPSAAENGPTHVSSHTIASVLATRVVFPPLCALEHPASKAGKPCVGVPGGTCGDAECVACMWHRVHIPTAFTSLKQYVSVMKSALIHEINRQLGAVALPFRKTVTATLPKGVHSPTPSQTASLVRALRSKRIMFYSKCELIIHYPSTYFKDRGFGGSPQSKPVDVRPSALYLKIDPSEMEKSSEYGKDDMWIVSTSPTMPCSPGLPVSGMTSSRKRGHYDDSGDDPGQLSHSVVFRSVYHGPSSRGTIELVPLLAGDKYPVLGGRKAVSVYAIRGPNASSDVNMLAVLQAMETSPCPLSPVLVKGASGGREASAMVLPTQIPGSSATVINFDDASAGTQPSSARKAPPEPDPFDVDISEADMSAIRERIVAQFTLNCDQAAVLSSVQDWFCPAGTSQASLPCDSPVTLVHGVFGSGKSHLLVATITLLSSLFEHSKCRDVQRPQICVASATNVAVDNVLLALQRCGHHDFARVGSVKKVAKPILPVTAHSAGPETTRAIADLKFMLAASGRNAVSGAERDAVADAVSKLESKKNRSVELMARRVIGVTCAATAVTVLENRRFAVVLLDEASQMVEPASLLSVARFAARRLLAVGDPLQLPPTLPSAPVYRTEAADAGDGHSLERTLFERLAQNGIAPIMLRTQYRCHPVFSGLSSAHFYQGQLVDGVTPEQRPALVARAPPLIFYDCTGGSERVGFGGSIVNDTEARVVAQLVNELLSAGLASSSIGIICLYKAQCDAVNDAVRAAVTEFDTSAVQISTVDAFQGAERDVIIVSCCRTEKLGFIVSSRRLNVALSRARHHLLVVGHRDTLRGNPVWKSVIDTAAKTPGGIRGIGRRPLLLPSM